MESRLHLRDTKARIAVDRRINRWNWKFRRSQVLQGWGMGEVRIDVGSRYRVYAVLAAAQVGLLLSGGDKRTQDAVINRACEFW